MNGWCSHAGYDLSNGKSRDGVVTCPMHGAEFDLKTGMKLSYAWARDMRVHLVSVEGWEVFLDI